PGTALEVMKPMGNFYTSMEAGQKKRYVAFAAGSGITPIMSLIKTALTKESESEFLLFYGNKNSQSIIFKEELDRLVNDFGDRFKVHYIFSREETMNPLYCGRMD